MSKGTGGPKFSAEQWLDLCRGTYNAGADMIWFNITLERRFEFIPDGVWNLVKETFSQQEFDAGDGSSRTLGKLCRRQPWLPFLGPLALDAGNVQGSKKFVTLVSASRLKKIVDVAARKIDEINNLANRIASASPTVKNTEEVEGKMYGLIQEINDSFTSLILSSSDKNLPPIQGKQRVKTKRDKALEDLSVLLLPFKDKVGEIAASPPMINNLLNMRWIAPAEEFLAKVERSTTESKWALDVRRAIEVLGLRVFNDEEAQECRFLIQFSVGQEHRNLVRKPTMLSNGDERVYATYRDKNIDLMNPVQGFGRTVDLSTQDVGLEEAVVPTALVTAMVEGIHVVGILLPSDIIALQNMRTHPNFVLAASTNRLKVLGIPSI